MSEARNPYAAPVASLGDPVTPLRHAEALIEYGRRVPFDRCFHWISEAFGLFFQRPWKWLGTMLLLFILSLLVSIIPLSNWLTTILTPVVTGGIAYALDVQRQTRTFRLRDVFAGFGPSFLPLAAVGCAALLTYAIMFAVFFIMIGGDEAIAIALGARQRGGGLPRDFWSALIVSMLLAFPLTAATYLASPLIILHGASPVRAMKMSFCACLKNVVPWILFGILMLLLIVLSMLPLLLGLFVTLPVAVMAFYAIYRDIFVDEMRE